MRTACQWCDQYSEPVVARRRSKGPKLLVCDTCGGRWLGSWSAPRVERSKQGKGANPRIGELVDR